MIETIKHVFGGGVYLKIWKIKDSESVAQHKHKFDHLSSVMSGCVVVEVEGEANRIIYSPDAVLIRSGVTHCFTAINGDAVIGCIHATDIIDPDNIDMELVAP